jgi:zinc protease
MADFMRLTQDDLKRYYETYYNPANAFLVVVGDFHRQDLLSRIEKAFGSIPGGNPPNQKKNPDPKQTGERRVVVKKEAQLPTVVMAYHVPNLKSQDSYVLEVIAAVLSGGKSSRLYERLVLEKRLVLEAEADHSLLSVDPNLFYLSASPLPGKDVAEVEKSLEAEIEKLQKEPPGERELEKAKNQMESSFIYAQDSLFAQAMLLARHEIALSWKALDEYLPSIRKVTPEDVRRVAREYLNPDNRTVGILLPLPAKEGAPPPGSPLKQRGTVR